jgi:hypothetical protein
MRTVDTFSSLHVNQGFSTVLVLISNLENNRRSLDANDSAEHNGNDEAKK